jgi:hypothetical protein
MLLLTQSNVDKANYDVFLNMFSQKDRDFDKSFEAMSRIVNFAGKYGYTVLPIKNLQRDGIHPSWAGYKDIADQTK